MIDFGPLEHGDGPVGADTLDAAERSFGIRFPADYRHYLLIHGSGEGWIGEHFLQLWKAEELVGWNRDYLFPESAPDLIAFGSNGGGEAFAFDRRHDPMPIVMAPFIGLAMQNAIRVADGFDHLFQRMLEEPDSLF